MAEMVRREARLVAATVANEWGRHDSGVVHQDVQCPPRRQKAIREIINRHGSDQIERCELDSWDRLHSLFRLLWVARCNDDTRAGGCQSASRLDTNP